MNIYSKIECGLTLHAETLISEAERSDKYSCFPEKNFAIFRDLELLSVISPLEYGGAGLSLREATKIVSLIAQYCAASALILGMHYSQLQTLLIHKGDSSFFDDFLNECSKKQLLLASATTEKGILGDSSQSNCSLVYSLDEFSLEKNAPVISYAESADALLITCKRSADDEPTAQSLVVARKKQLSLEKTSNWDALGFRGTCSAGYIISVSANIEQIFPVSYSVILMSTMHPASHILWGGVWIGIAEKALNKVKKQQISFDFNYDTDLIESLVRAMKNKHSMFIEEYSEIFNSGDILNAANLILEANNLKIYLSETLVKVVQESMMVCGLSSYRNDSEFSLTRELRDAYGALLMINNRRLESINKSLKDNMLRLD